METRLASHEDAPALAALHGESFGESCWSRAQIADSLALATTRGWMVVDGHLPQGLILCQMIAGEVEILTFCVSPLAASRFGSIAPRYGHCRCAFAESTKNIP
jgi:hypothetical protein